MKVILKQDIKGVGKNDQVIEASDGYARNYLLPKGLAVKADVGNMNNLQNKKDSVAYKKEEDKKEALVLAEKLKKTVVKLHVKTGDNGKVFGSVTSKEIAEALKKDFNIDVDKKKILLDDVLTSLGYHNVKIELHKKVIAEIKIIMED